MTDQYTELRQALAKCADIIKHPWHWHADPVKGDPLSRSRYEVVTIGRTITRTYYTDEDAPREAEVICTAVNAAPSLLAERDRLREALTKIENEAAVFGGGFGGWVVDVAREALKEQQ